MSPNRSYLLLEGIVTPGKKTVAMHVKSRSKGDILGVIKWHGAWRQYIFESWSDTLWSGGCLQELQGFLKGANDGHRDQLRAQRKTAVKGK